MQSFIEVSIDVSNNPEMQLMAIEGDIQGIITECAKQLGRTRQAMLKEVSEGGDIRSGVTKEAKKAGPCKVYRLGSIEMDAYIKALSV